MSHDFDVAALSPFLMTGRADMASLSVADGRKKAIDFADPHGVPGVIAPAPAAAMLK